MIFCIDIDNKIDHLVLGEWGCDVFLNNPFKVARVFCNLSIKYSGYFKSISFFMAREDKNYHIFKSVIK